MLQRVYQATFHVQDRSFELPTDDSGFLNWASSDLDSTSPTGDDGSSFSRPPPPSGSLEDSTPSFERPPPPSSTSMNDHGLLTKSPSDELGPDTKSTDFGFDNNKSDFFKKPVDNVPLEELGSPAMLSAGRAKAPGVDPMSWSLLLYDYSQGTTMHGLPYITRKARFNARRLFVSSTTHFRRFLCVNSKPWLADFMAPPPKSLGIGGIIFSGVSVRE